MAGQSKHEISRNSSISADDGTSLAAEGESKSSLPTKLAPKPKGFKKPEVKAPVKPADGPSRKSSLVASAPINSKVQFFESKIAEEAAAKAEPWTTRRTTQNKITSTGTPGSSLDKSAGDAPSKPADSILMSTTSVEQRYLNETSMSDMKAVPEEPEKRNEEPPAEPASSSKSEPVAEDGSLNGQNHSRQQEQQRSIGDLQRDDSSLAKALEAVDILASNGKSSKMDSDSYSKPIDILPEQSQPVVALLQQGPVRSLEPEEQPSMIEPMTMMEQTKNEPPRVYPQQLQQQYVSSNSTPVLSQTPTAVFIGKKAIGEVQQNVPSTPPSRPRATTDEPPRSSPGPLRNMQGDAGTPNRSNKALPFVQPSGFDQQQSRSKSTDNLSSGQYDPQMQYQGQPVAVTEPIVRQDSQIRAAMEGLGENFASFQPNYMPSNDVGGNGAIRPNETMIQMAELENPLHYQPQQIQYQPHSMQQQQPVMQYQPYQQYQEQIAYNQQPPMQMQPQFQAQMSQQSPHSFAQQRLGNSTPNRSQTELVGLGHQIQPSMQQQQPPQHMVQQQQFQQQQQRPIAQQPAPVKTTEELPNQQKPLQPASPQSAGDQSTFAPLTNQQSGLEDVNITSKSIKKRDDKHRDSHGRNKLSVLGLENYKPPTVEEDQAFLQTLPPTQSPEIILQALNGYQLLPYATAQKPYLRIDVSRPARLGRSNTQKHPNFISMGMSLVVSRNHLELWEYQGNYFVADVGSNSGTWLNGQRLSDAGVASLHFQLKTGDIIRIGADYKTKEDELRDSRHKCIIVRVVCRKPDPKSNTTSAKSTITDKFEQRSPSQIPTQHQKKVTAASAAASMNPPKPSIIPSRNDGWQQGVNTGGAAGFDPNAPLNDDTVRRMPDPSSARMNINRYFMLFSASTLPFKVRRLGIHSPSYKTSDISSAATSSKTDLTSENGNLVDFIGPEVVTVNLKNWGSSREQKYKIVLHDNRSMNRNGTQFASALEIVRQGDSSMFSMVLLLAENQVSNNGSRGRGSVSAIKLATLEQLSNMKTKLTLCYETLVGYQTDTNLMEQFTAGSAIPANMLQGNSGSGSLRGSPRGAHAPLSGVFGSGATSPLSMPPHSVDPDLFPSITLLGELSQTAGVNFFGLNGISTEVKLEPSPLLKESLNSNSQAPPEDALLDKTKCLIVLKRAPPSRLQQLAGEIRGKQSIKKGVRETKWIVGAEFIEEMIWNDIEQIALQSNGLELSRLEGQAGAEIRWVYKKEWWSLVLLGSVVFGYLKD